MVGLVTCADMGAGIRKPAAWSWGLPSSMSSSSGRFSCAGVAVGLTKLSELWEAFLKWFAGSGVDMFVDCGLGMEFFCDKVTPGRLGASPTSNDRKLLSPLYDSCQSKSSISGVRKDCSSAESTGVGWSKLKDDPVENTPSGSCEDIEVL